MQIKITTDATRAQNMLRSLTMGLKDPSRPLEQSIKWIYNDVEQNFKSEGKLYGGWARLAPRTLQDKARLGYGGKQILERTGKLKKGFNWHMPKHTVATIDNKVEYFPIHQLGKRPVPQRKMLDVRPEGINAIVNYFVNWIINLVKGY
jgi:phage gpG-like protein